MRNAECGIRNAECGIANVECEVHAVFNVLRPALCFPDSVFDVSHSPFRIPRSAFRIEERHERSAITSDVVSTIAPQTTWKLLIQGSRRLRIVSAPSVTCV